MGVSFTVKAEASNSRARRGALKTLNAVVETPVFMPVGTHAAVRGVTMGELDELGFRMLLANTYHLLLRPGPDFFVAKGGIRNFSKWNHGFLTDSGGFQIFSLPHARKITEEGAEFRSYLDGKMIKLTPESSIETQKAIGSDIMMVLDECIPSTSPESEAVRAMELTHRWALRSLAARGESPQAVFAIVQGACFENLRKMSASFLTQHPFDGFAIGGLAVGESKAEREDMTAVVTDLLPKDRPRYLMGVGTPIDLLEAVHRGVDMFDCVLPTMLGQQGVAFTRTGKIDLRKGKYRDSDEPIDSLCGCRTCSHYTQGYLHHLIKVHDPVGWNAVSIHNLSLYSWLMESIRSSISSGNFYEFYTKTRAELMQQIDTEGDDIIPTKGGYEIVRRPIKDAPEGRVFVSSVRHVQSGEVMHSSQDPVKESVRLYIEQSKLKERIRTEKQLVIWDVGLGAATNAMGVVRAYEEVQKESPELPLANISMISFEIDLDPIKLALEHPAEFHYLDHPAPKALIEKGAWKNSSGLTWKLIEGDFFNTMSEAPKPNLIFFDPFSYKVDSELWTYETFKKLFNQVGDLSALFTYSASTAVRAALIAAGFSVGYGQSTGLKKETTVAFTGETYDRYPEISLLSHKWLSRWERSHAKFPKDVVSDSAEVFESKLKSHHQFVQLRNKAHNAA